MSTKTTVTCDVRGCEKEADHKNKKVSVRFITEQNEGRSTSPYLTGEDLDFCEEHYEQYVNTLPLIGSGAMGFNDYYFEKGSDE